ncbi:MAG: hypothetical protein HC924_14670 [Synechococcaceae cyanobacterium SM2_3_2]|nr:hypothetical protein [Synechococcaceae cyanobacterium SM2_3_2]
MDRRTNQWDPQVWLGCLAVLGLGLMQVSNMAKAQALFSPNSSTVQTSEPTTLFRQIPAPATPAPGQPVYFQLGDPQSTSGSVSNQDFDPNVDPAVDPTLMEDGWSVEDEAQDLSDGPVFELDLRQQLGTEGGGTGPSFGGGGTGSGTGGTGGTSGTGSGSGVGSGSGFGPGESGGSGGSGESGGLHTGAEQRLPQITGLIVDARGLDFEPSMSMRLFDPDGNQIYTVPGLNQELNTDLVAGEGTAAYATSEDQISTLTRRIGERPHRIRAVRTLGYDLVISNDDAWFLRQSNEMDRYLDNLSVVVMWDPSFARSL